MKLLSPSPDKKEATTLKEILRTQETNKAADAARKNLAKSEAEFNAALSRHRLAWIKEEEEHEQRKREMKQEIDSLEGKRLNALIPVNIIRSGTGDRFNEAVSYLAAVRKREEDNELLAEQLQDKLDEVGQREQDLKTLSESLTVKQEGLDIQGVSIVTGVKKLSADLADFLAFKNKTEKEIDERKTALVLWEQTLVSKEASQKRTDTALNELGIQLADERRNLQVAWDELERKRKNIPITKM